MSQHILWNWYATLRDATRLHPALSWWTNTPSCTYHKIRSQVVTLIAVWNDLVSSLHFHGFKHTVSRLLYTTYYIFALISVRFQLWTILIQNLNNGKKNCDQSQLHKKSCPSVRQSVSLCPSVRQSIRSIELSIHRSIEPSVHQGVCIWPSVHRVHLVYQAVSPSGCVRQSIKRLCPSVRQSIESIESLILSSLRHQGISLSGCVHLSVSPSWPLSLLSNPSICQSIRSLSVYFVTLPWRLYQLTYVLGRDSPRFLLKKDVR